MDCAPHFQYIQTLLEIVPISEAAPFFLSCSTVIWQTVVTIIYNSRKGPVHELINWRHLQLVTEGRLLTVVIPRYRRVSQSYGDLGKFVRNTFWELLKDGVRYTMRTQFQALNGLVAYYVSISQVVYQWRWYKCWRWGGGIFNPLPNLILFCRQIIFF